MSGDIRAAVRLVETHRHELMNQEQWLRLETWLSKFPESVINVEPDLLVLSAWISSIPLAARQNLEHGGTD